MFYPQGSTTSCHQLSKPQLYSTETNGSFTIVRMDKFSIHYGAINWHRILQMGIEKFWLCFLFLMALGYQRGGGLLRDEIFHFINVLNNAIHPSPFHHLSLKSLILLLNFWEVVFLLFLIFNQLSWKKNTLEKYSSVIMEVIAGISFAFSRGIKNSFSSLLLFSYNALSFLKFWLTWLKTFYNFINYLKKKKTPLSKYYKRFFFFSK